MVQAYAQELLNQKESPTEDSLARGAGQPTLAAAKKRLINALGRLERNLNMVIEQQEQGGDQQQQLALFEKENNGLRHERENLNFAISQLQNQYSDLHQVASTIYGKLDDSIKQLTQIIEN